MKTYLVSAEDGKLNVRLVDSYKKRDYRYEVHFFFACELKLYNKKDKLIDQREIGDDSGKIKRAILFDPHADIVAVPDKGHLITRAV